MSAEAPDSGALTTAGQRRPGLPVEITGFVGRQRELARLIDVLSIARLVTVTGPGGVGKTRIALRAAARLAEDFADGVCLVELSGLRDAELLPDAVANCLGLPETDARSRLDAITELLRDRELLLILDTCEHLVDACAMFTDVLLRATTRVTVLATSRQPLDVPGEHTLAVPPLGAEEAAELFAQRAATVVPGFAVCDANRATVTALCQRLDGVPLALELATVRLRALSLDQLSSCLKDRFRLLTGVRRAALPHHQTLRTATEWSYDLCTPQEQLLWARLSVFAGPFDIAAAEDVCSGGPLPPADILATLIGLVDKSVVLREATGDGRYRLLGTIREFGAEKLAATGDATAVRERYLNRYVAMAEQFGEEFADDQLAGYRALRAEHAGIRAAVAIALSYAMNAELSDIMGIAHGLEVLGWVAVRQQRYERSALLLGAAAQKSAQQTELPGGLTGREHEIAALVAEGLSNREIAHRLIISKRTVDAHLEHIFAKLGVSSRVQLATWLQSAPSA